MREPAYSSLTIKEPVNENGKTWQELIATVEWFAGEPEMYSVKMETDIEKGPLVEVLAAVFHQFSKILYAQITAHEPLPSANLEPIILQMPGVTPPSAVSPMEFFRNHATGSSVQSPEGTKA